jgi:carotenoid cleavage dioxygenase
VRTRQFFEDASFIDPETGVVDLTVAAANTHVVSHAGRILALVESSFPTEVTCDLRTIGTHDFSGKLATAMTAHPKICPRTGEMHFFGYGFSDPFLVYHCVDGEGRLVASETIPVAGPTMVHDFAITDRSVVFMDLPVVFDLERALSGTMPFSWSEDYGTRVGVMPRGGTGDEVRWFEIEPCYVFHPLNAYENGNKLIVDVARYDELWRTNAGKFDPAYLHRWTIDRDTGSVREQRLDDREIEFPRIDERRTGERNKYGYTVWSRGNVGNASAALVKYDLTRDRADVHEFGPGRSPGEGVFVPASDNAGEDEGWLLTVVYDAASDCREVVVLDASNLSAKPIAAVRLPRRVPFGFHGSWIARN